MGKVDSVYVVFGWGLKDERLCIEPSDVKKKTIYMAPTMLHQLNKLKVKSIACGNSFSLALTDKGSVYSWGIGLNGSLGLGDTILSTAEPMKIQFYFPS